jgi:calcineurin-like phosphoesterase family protein
MNYHIISDTHLNHTKMDTWGGRSGDWQEQILAGLRRIPKGDILIHLGDICIGEDEEAYRKIKAATDGVRCILVRGNHDRKSLTWYQERWDLAADGLDLLFNGHYLHLTHRPQRSRANISYNIHGHTHGNLHRSEEYVDFYHKEYHIDISPELVGYKPIRLDTLLNTPAKKRKYPEYGA